MSSSVIFGFFVLFKIHVSDCLKQLSDFQVIHTYICIAVPQACLPAIQGLIRISDGFSPRGHKFNPITDLALCLKTVTSQEEGRDLHRWRDGRRVIKRNPWVIKEVSESRKCGISGDRKGQMMINSERSLHLRLRPNVCQWHHTQRDII